MLPIYPIYPSTCVTFSSLYPHICFTYIPVFTHLPDLPIYLFYLSTCFTHLPVLPVYLLNRYPFYPLSLFPVPTDISVLPIASKNSRIRETNFVDCCYLKLSVFQSLHKVAVRLTHLGVRSDKNTCCCSVGQNIWCDLFYEEFLIEQGMVLRVFFKTLEYCRHF